MTRKEMIQTHAAARRADESHKWPVRDRFNATERAIRRLRRAGIAQECDAEAYALALDAEISRIVNAAI